MQITNKLTPFLWYDNQAEAAARFYCKVFEDAELLDVSTTPEGSHLSATFRIGGVTLVAFNGGPHYKLSPSLSLMVTCNDQAETDRLWSAFVESGGKPLACGWITDQFGLTWQITPERLLQLMYDPDKAKALRVMRAMQEMVKIDIAALDAAARDA